MTEQAERTEEMNATIDPSWYYVETDPVQIARNKLARESSMLYQRALEYSKQGRRKMASRYYRKSNIILNDLVGVLDEKEQAEWIARRNS